MRFMLVVLLTGCAAHWVHPTKSDQEGYEDSFQCQQLAVAAVPRSSVPSIDDPQHDYWASCMRAKGWREQ